VEAGVTKALVEAMVNRLDTTITVAAEEEDIKEDTEAEGTEDTKAEDTKDTEVDQAASLALKTSAPYYR